ERATSARSALCREHDPHDAFERGLDLLGGGDLFAQDGPQLGVEHGGIEAAAVMAIMGFVGIPVCEFLDAPRPDPPPAVAGLRCGGAVADASLLAQFFGVLAHAAQP